MFARVTRLTAALVGSLVAGAAMAENVHDDSNTTKISYSPNWNAESSPVYARAVGGTLHETNVAGATATMNFSGDAQSISLVYTLHDNRGMMHIYIDGQFIETINARVAAPQRWQVMRTWKFPQPTTQHTITVVARGAAPGEDINKSWIDVDAFIVNANVALPNSVYGAGSSLLSYGGTWTWISDSTWGNRMQSQIPADSVRFTFYGTAVRWYYLARGNRGIANISLDGKPYGTWDTYAPGEQELYYDIRASAPGIHTVTLTVSGSRNPASSNAIIDVSDFYVFP